MKKFNFVELINVSDSYKNYNMYLGVKGIVLEVYDKTLKILFFNEFNEGEYAFIEVLKNDIKLLDEQPPQKFVDFIKTNLDNFQLKEKGFKPKTFVAYQQVELLIDDEEYSKFGAHKGDVGTIMEDVAVEDYILVDFGRVDENNNYYGDCISVKLQDVKILKKD